MTITGTTGEDASTSVKTTLHDKAIFPTVRAGAILSIFLSKIALVEGIQERRLTIRHSCGLVA